MDGSLSFNNPSHCVTHYLAAVSDGDEILMVIKPGPAVGTAGVVHPFTTVGVMGVHRAINGALNGFLSQGHHRPILKGENLFHLVCGGRGNCVGDHGVGLN